MKKIGLCLIGLMALLVGCKPDPVVLTSIKVTKNPTKVVYTEGEVFEPAGMEVTATFSDESTKVVTDYEYSPKGALALNTNSVSISYTFESVTKNTSVAITVNKKVADPEKTPDSEETPDPDEETPDSDEEAPANVLESISITTPPTKTEYLDGEEFDKTGMKVTAKFSVDGDKVVENYTVTPKTLAYTDEKVTVSYTSEGVTKTVTQAISVKPILKKIEIATNPTKVLYKAGEKFDKTGMVVKATYSDNKSAEITDYDYSLKDELEATDKLVTVSFEKDNITETADVEITVEKTSVKDRFDVAKNHFSEDDFEITGGTFTKEGNVITLTPDAEDTKYEITGYFNGQIINNVKGTELTLKGAYIEYNEGDAAIKSTKKLGIKLEKDTVNYIGNNGESEEKIAAILCEKGIELGGSGTGYIAGNVLHGIKGSKVEAKGSGTYHIEGTADGSAINCNEFSIGAEKSVKLYMYNSKNGIKADNTIVISSGDLYFTNIGTALKTDTSKDDPEVDHYITLADCGIYYTEGTKLYNTEKDAVTKELALTKTNVTEEGIPADEE